MSTLLFLSKTKRHRSRARHSVLVLSIFTIFFILFVMSLQTTSTAQKIEVCKAAYLLPQWRFTAGGFHFQLEMEFALWMDEIQFTFDLPNSFFIDAKEAEQHYTVEALHTLHIGYVPEKNSKAKKKLHKADHNLEDNNGNDSNNNISSNDTATNKSTNTSGILSHKHKDEHPHHRNSRGAEVYSMVDIHTPTHNNNTNDNNDSTITTVQNEKKEVINKSHLVHITEDKKVSTASVSNDNINSEHNIVQSLTTVHQVTDIRHLYEPLQLTSAFPFDIEAPVFNVKYDTNAVRITLRRHYRYVYDDNAGKKDSNTISLHGNNDNVIHAERTPVLAQLTIPIHARYENVDTLTKFDLKSFVMEELHAYVHRCLNQMQIEWTSKVCDTGKATSPVEAINVIDEHCTKIPTGVLDDLHYVYTTLMALLTIGSVIVVSFVETCKKKKFVKKI